MNFGQELIDLSGMLGRLLLQVAYFDVLDLLDFVEFGAEPVDFPVQLVVGIFQSIKRISFL